MDRGIFLLSACPEVQFKKNTAMLKPRVTVALCRIKVCMQAGKLSK